MDPSQHKRGLGKSPQCTKVIMYTSRQRYYDDPSKPLEKTVTVRP